MAFAHPEFLVSTDWLAQHLEDGDVRVFETTVFLHRGDGGGVRAESGRSEYVTGHIVGAGFLDLQADFSDNDQPLLKSVSSLIVMKPTPMKRPAANMPQMPPTPWIAQTSRESSSLTRVFSQTAV